MATDPYAGTHYSDAQKTYVLAATANEIATNIYNEFKPLNLTPVFLYTGMSGIALATAVSLAMHVKHPDMEFRMVYVRKHEEKSHGERLEFNYDAFDIENGVFVFLDDMVSSGETVVRCYNEALQYAKIVGTKFTYTNALGEKKISSYFSQSYRANCRERAGVYEARATAALTRSSYIYNKIF